MVERSHREVQATAWRELAKRARRLAGTLLDGPDRNRLLEYSEELTEKAEKLESSRAGEQSVESEGAATTMGRPRSPFAAHDRAASPAKEQAMNWDRVAGNWKQMTGKVKEKWGKLTDDDLTVIDGKQDQLVGRVQERYGIEKDEAERQVKEWSDRM